ncbi:MAG: DUF4962 domain-containing protein, partial [Candidatus Hydrogenedentes bacterium]|nr:DUF4962 domain-containing protein [Candidatus Hydrogenedentota bacterium]
MRNDTITGAQLKYTWRELEPERDHYDLSLIGEDLSFLEEHNRKLFIQIQDVSFDEEKLVPEYLMTDPAFGGGVARKYEEGEDGKATFDGWVARRWDPAVRERFIRLLAAIGKEFDGRIEGINLPETSIGFGESGKYHPSGFTYEQYRDGVKATMRGARDAFPRSHVIQYANFMPGEWLPWDDKGYLRSVYAYAASIGIGVGGPDVLPHRKGQLSHSYPLIASRGISQIAGVAVQDGNLAEVNPESGKRVNARELYTFAKSTLKVNYIFWGVEEPFYSEDVIPFLESVRTTTSDGTNFEHPRLFFTAFELQDLRNARTQGIRANIWHNIAESADWCLKKKPRAEWIAPIADDPVYENLYDRFYAMMMDMAITEHLAFAYALCGEVRYGDAAKAWTLGCCRAWRPDADAQPDGGKAYAVMRLLKGVAVGYDLAFDLFTEDERAEIRAMLSTTAANYFEKYFTTPAISGEGFHTHHAIVEWSSFGIAALTLLNENPDAQKWLDATVGKFTTHLLPMGLAPDGAQVEGATFWASTMHYRIFFMDALRRVTGRDLFNEFASKMNADLALASIAAEKRDGWDKPHETVLLSPSYGQLNYYAPVLLAMAREYKRPIYQYLARWDHTLGSIQETRYITPNRKEQLLFELGGYAYCWCDASVPAEAGDAPLAFSFPSVYQAYARESWQPGGIVAAVDRGGQVVICAGGATVLVASGLSSESKAVPTIANDG